MNINFVVTSKPCDGLLFYSYEYCSHLNSVGIDATVCIIPHRNFTPEDYVQALSDKYIHFKNVEFDDIDPKDDDITMIMGRSMLTLSYLHWRDYNSTQRLSLKRLFQNRIISVYSTNHPKDYPNAVEFYYPKHIIDLCDKEVYPNGVGEHFEKTIHFDIYKEPVGDKEFNYLFLGTNESYYKTIQKIIHEYPDHGILTYDEKYINNNNNNLFAPVKNLLSKFQTYVYTKDTFDPAPRIFQECRYFNKDIIYQRDKNIKDGGPVYWKRGVQKQNIQPIISCINNYIEYIK